MVHVCMYMCVRETGREIAAFIFSYYINWLLYKFCIKTVWDGRGVFFLLTQPITWFPLTLVSIFFSRQKYLFFLLSALEIVFQGMTLMERALSAYSMEVSGRLITFGKDKKEMWNVFTYLSQTLHSMRIDTVRIKGPAATLLITN